MSRAGRTGNRALGGLEKALRASKGPIGTSRALESSSSFNLRGFL